MATATTSDVKKLSRSRRHDVISMRTQHSCLGSRGQRALRPAVGARPSAALWRLEVMSTTSYRTTTTRVQREETIRAVASIHSTRLAPSPSTSSSPPPPTNRRSKSSSVHNRTNRVGRWHGSRSLRLRGAQLLTGSATRLPCVLMRSCISIITVRSRSTGR